MLPHHLHEAAAVRCLEAGKHVLLEKPMAPTLDACERILAAARTAGTVFLVAENAQYWPEVLIAKRALESGAIGEMVTARAALFFPPLQEFYGEGNWRFEHAASGGGVSIDTGSHYLRPLRMWLGEIDEVVAAMERPYDKMQGESLARALLRFRSGVVASFDLLLTPAPVWRQEMFRVTGTRGEIVIDARVLLCDGSNRKGTPLEPDLPQGYLLSYTGEFADFAGAILRGTTPAAPAEYSLGELRTALAMERSARSRRWEKIWD
jgi:predicted dehydrogenase